jgi:hypothetical protein
VTLSKDTGTGVFVPAAGEHVNFTLTDSNGAGSVLDAPTSTCDNAGANTNASGQCTIVFTSATPGKVTGHASSTLSVGGSANFTVEGLAPDRNGVRLSLTGPASDAAAHDYFHTLRQLLERGTHEGERIFA